MCKLFFCFLFMLSTITGCSHDIDINNQDSGDTAQFETASSAGSSTTYCYSAESLEENSFERKKKLHE